jgi:tetratricopeptide (TPR) repeat protein
MDSDVLIDALDGLTSLVDKSLLKQVEGVGGEPRFVMLETIREYALEWLAASGEDEGVRQRHAAYFLRFAEMAEPELRRAQQRAWFDRLETEHDNLRAALAWSQTAEAGAEIGLRLAGALGWFWSTRSHWNEGRKWLDSILARPAAEPLISARAKALAAASRLALAHNDFVVARATSEESQTLFRSVGDIWGQAFALLHLAWSQPDVAVRRASLEESLTLFRSVGDIWGQALILADLAWFYQSDQALGHGLAAESLALFRIAGDIAAQAYVLRALAQIAHYQADYRQATIYDTESLALAQAIGDLQRQADVLGHLALLAQAQDDDAQAAAYLAEAIALNRDLGMKEGILWNLCLLGSLALRRGDTQQAAAHLIESLEGFREREHHGGIGACLAGLAGMASMEGRFVRAIRLFGAAAAIRDTVGEPRFPEEQIDIDRQVDVARTQLDPESFTAAWATGRALPLEQAIAEALQVSEPAGS